MGNTLLATQSIACGHADYGSLKRNLLCDRLSQPTAEMVDALLALQGQTVWLQQFAHRDGGDEPPTAVDMASRPMQLLAMSYCILFGYQCRDGADEQVLPSCRGSDPTQPNEFMEAFRGAMRDPQQFLQDLLSLRAQVVSADKIMRLLPLMEDIQVTPRMLCGPFGEVLQNLVTFIRAAVECAEIYREIQDTMQAGHLDKNQVAKLLEGNDSDQRSMINAMGGGSLHDDDEEDLYV